MQTDVFRSIKPWLALVVFFMILLAAPGLIYAGQENEATSSAGGVETLEVSTPKVEDDAVPANFTTGNAETSEVSIPKVEEDAVPANSATTTHADSGDEVKVDPGAEGEEPDRKEIVPADETAAVTEQKSGSFIPEDEDAEPAEKTKVTGSGGNSYKAEISVDGGDATTGMNQDVELTVTFTELGATTPLGSARIGLNNNFRYGDYADGASSGLTVNSYLGVGPASGWTAQWETINSLRTIALRAIADGIDGDANYLGQDDWVSVTFNAVTPIAPVNPLTGMHVADEFEFATAAWIDNSAANDDLVNPTNINNMGPGHSNPQVTVTPSIGRNILTAVELREITGSTDDGQPILGPLPEPMPHPDDEILDLHIEYDFELDAGHPYQAGSYYEFYLPEVFKVFSKVDGDLRDAGNRIFGTYRLAEDGKVTLRFNERISGSTTPILGFVSFNTEILKENLGEDLEQIIRIEIKDNITKEIVLSFEPNVASSIDKRGIPNRAYNTENIRWEVDFNKNLQTISSPVLSDLLGANQSLTPNSVRLYNLIVKLDGSVEQGDLVDSGYIVEMIEGSNDFQLLFTAGEGETPTISSAYRLVFTTSIDDEDGTSYGNTATLTGDDFDDLTASATVAVRRGRTLEKRSTAYDAANQVISWEIRANYNEKTLSAAESVITDTFGVNQLFNQQFVDGSLVIYEIVIDANGNEASATPLLSGFVFELTDDGGDPARETGFRITFPDGITGAYRIVYQTEAVDRVFSDATVTNTVNFNNVTVTARRNVQQMILSKTHAEENYAFKTVSWTIQVNRDSYVMTDLVLEDIFTNRGLTYREGSLEILGLPEGVDYKIEPPYDPTVQTGFQLSFTEPVTGPLTITFVTNFDYEQRAERELNYFENQATATWTDEAQTARMLSVTRRFTPDTYTQANGFKRGSYNAITKEITWTVGVNYNLQTVTGATITDFILGDQTLIVDSIRVYEALLGGGINQITPGDQLANPDIVLLENTDGFRVNLGDITRAYIIEFVTSIDDRLIVAHYQNTASLRDGANNLHAVLGASVSVQGGGTYTDKEAEQEGRIIQWRMVINEGQSALSAVRVEDELSAGQIFLRDSLALYATTVAVNGALTRGARLVENTDYTLVVTASDDHLAEGDTFTLRFIGDIDRAFMLEYQSFVLVGNNRTVSNNATLYAAEAGLPEDRGSAEDVLVRITAGQGGIYGELGNLTVRKRSANDNSLLPGAVFDLFHETGNFRIATGVTDENGSLVFRNLVYGTYYVREVSAPDGYLVHDEETVAVVGSPEQTVEILNDLIIRDVRLRKTDAAESNHNRAIAGAVFELRIRNGDGDGTVLGTYTTDQNGIIFVADLEPGSYAFVEIDAAPYYRLDPTPVPFTIGAEQISVSELTTENIFISVGLTKTDDFDQAILLAGVLFRLEDSDGEVIHGNLVTDQNGRIEVAGLLPGRYRFVELATAPHYQLDQTPVEFEVSEDQIQTLELFKRNRLIPGAINLLKVDRRSGEPLAGAVFRLIYENNLVIAENLVTDAEGRINISGLRPGSYRLEELRAPAGYILPHNRVTVVIVGLSDPNNNSGDIQELEIGNTRRSARASNPDDYWDRILQAMQLNLLAEDSLTDPKKAAAEGIALPQTGGGISTVLIVLLASVMAITGFAVLPRSNCSSYL